MSQNPYAQFGSPAHAPGRYGEGGDGGGFDRYPTPQRTSVLAIMALVTSLLCFLPLGPLALIFGGAAIIFISTSRGRLGGLGLAIAGVLIGLFTTVVWLFVVIGAMSIFNNFGAMITEPASKMMANLDSSDFAAARTHFSPTMDTKLSDQQLAEFVAAYQAEMGSFQGMPKSFTEFIGGYAKVGQAMQNYRGQNEMPMPAQFDGGWAIVLAGLPRGGATRPQPGGVMPQLENLGILVAPGKEIWLLDPRTLQPVDNSAAGSGGSGGGGAGGGGGSGGGG